MSQTSESDQNIIVGSQPNKHHAHFAIGVGSDVGSSTHTAPGEQKASGDSLIKNIDIKAWLSVTLLMLITVPVMSPLYGVSLLIDSMKEHFDTSTTVVGWVASMSWFLITGFSGISGMFVDTNNAISSVKLAVFIGIICLYVSSICNSVLVMYCSLGIGYGIGANLCYYSASIQAGTYFSRTKNLNQYKAANAYVQMCCAFAQITSAFLFSYTLKHGKWQDSLQTSAMLLFIVGYGALSGLDALSNSTSNRSNETERNTKKDEDNSLPVRERLMNSLKAQFSAEMLKLPAFYWLFLDLFLFWTSNLVGLMFLPAEMTTKGYQNEQITVILLQGFGSLCSRIPLSVASAIWPFKFFKIYPLKGAILAVCFLTSFLLDAPTSYYVLSIGVGFSSGIAGTGVLIVTQEVLGKKTNAFTWVLVAVGSGGLFGPVLGAVIFDLSGSYRLAFEIASTMACISATLSVLAAMSRHSKEIKKQKSFSCDSSRNRRRSSKMVHKSGLAPHLYLRRNSNSYFVFEKVGEKYQFKQIIDRPQELRDPSHDRSIMDIEDLFHGKFDINNACDPYEMLDEEISDP